METVVKKSDWKTLPMPEEHGTFILDRHFSQRELDILRRGHIPQEMEDKWFWYMEGDKLYGHRSWTGYCIFVVEIGEGSQHKVTVNRYTEQYRSAGDEADRVALNKLLDWWCQPEYDYYGEWLSETAANLKAQGMISEEENEEQDGTGI